MTTCEQNEQQCNLTLLQLCLFLLMVLFFLEQFLISSGNYKAHFQLHNLLINY